MPQRQLRPVELSWALLPAALLVAVALLQVYRFYVDELTPWKGGGFGMFAATESGSSRVPQLYLVRSVKGENYAARVPVPHHDRELRRALRELRAVPTQQRFQRVVEQISAFKFGLYPDDDDTALSAAEVERVLRPDLSSATQTAPDTSDSRRYRVLPKGGPGTLEHEGTPIPYDALRLELWRIEFLPGKPALSAKLHRVATVPSRHSLAQR